MVGAGRRVPKDQQSGIERKEQRQTLRLSWVKFGEKKLEKIETLVAINTNLENQSSAKNYKGNLMEILINLLLWLMNERRTLKSGLKITKVERLIFKSNSFGFNTYRS